MAHEPPVRVRVVEIPGGTEMISVPFPIDKLAGRIRQMLEN
jgi:hypothetical protein